MTPSLDTHYDSEHIKQESLAPCPLVLTFILTVFYWFHFTTETKTSTYKKPNDAVLRRSCWLRCCSPPPPALMCSWDSDRVSGSSRPSGSVGLCRMSCMAFLRPVRPEAMKSAYVASTSDIAGASSTRRRLREKHMSLDLYRRRRKRKRLNRHADFNLLLKSQFVCGCVCV